MKWRRRKGGVHITLLWTFGLPLWAHHFRFCTLWLSRAYRSSLVISLRCWKTNLYQSWKFACFSPFFPLYLWFAKSAGLHNDWVLNQILVQTTSMLETNKRLHSDWVLNQILVQTTGILWPNKIFWLEIKMRDNFYGLDT